MPSCVFRGCTNYDSKVKKIQGITYHMFPTNAVRLQEWIASVRKQRNQSNWRPSKGSRICCNHFKSTDKYTSNKGRTLLKKTAVPFIQKPEDDSFNSQEDVSDKSFTSDSPITVALKKKVSALELEKAKIKKKNKILEQRNRRLVRRASIMRHMLKNLRKKNCILEQQMLNLNLKSEGDLEENIDIKSEGTLNLIFEAEPEGNLFPKSECEPEDIQKSEGETEENPRPADESAENVDIKSEDELDIPEQEKIYLHF